jgi:cell division protein FtsQ
MAKAASKSGIPWRLVLSILLWAGVGVCLLIVGRRVEAYAGINPQFRLEPANLSIHGLANASRSKVLRVFEPDFGRSVFLMPLAERRCRLLAVDWIEDATVSRLWPNRAVVRVTERRPVAFVSVPLGRNAGSKIALIDARGVLLERPPRAKFAFPVLKGVTPEQSERERAQRVEAMLSLLRDLGPAAAQVSEIDVSSLDNLSVVAEVDGSTVELVLGDRNLGRRFQSFAAHYAEIRKRTPEAAVFDLRLDDRITAKE